MIVLNHLFLIFISDLLVVKLNKYNADIKKGIKNSLIENKNFFQDF